MLSFTVKQMILGNRDLVLIYMIAIDSCRASTIGWFTRQSLSSLDTEEVRKFLASRAISY